MLVNGIALLLVEFLGIGSYQPVQAYSEGMTKAFAYLRVSGKGQIDGDGFTRQRACQRGQSGTAFREG